MNSMTAALVSAGLQVPTVKERIWRIIKDNPGITRKEITTRYTPIPEGSVSSSLRLMELRGMVYTKLAPGEIRRAGRRAMGLGMQFFTDMERYELLPMPKSKKAAPAPKLDIPTIGRNVATEPIGAIVAPASNDDLIIDNMTVGQAKALYLKLHKMFGGAK